MVLAFVALVLAAMRPQWGETPADASRRGRDIVVLLDVSLSMLASDGEDGTTRLGRARAGLTGLLDAAAADGGHRLALVTFSGRSTLMSPLSADYDLFRTRLALVDPRKAPGPGTQLQAALRTVLEDHVDDAPAYTDVIVISDGEDFGAPASEALPPAARLHAVSVGDAGRPTVLSVLGNDGRRVTIEYRGQPVRTRASPEALAALIAAPPATSPGRGELIDAGVGAVDLAAWYRRAIPTAPLRVLGHGSDAQPAERHGWFVVLALALIGVHAHRSYRAQQAATGATAPSTPSPVAPAALAVAMAAVAVLPGFSLLDPVSRAIRDGYEAFGEGRFDAAEAQFARAVGLDPGNAQARFNLGAARYRGHALEQAIEDFAAATADARLAGSAHYNIGVAHFQRAIAELEVEEVAQPALRQAITAFRRAISSSPEHAREDARYNLSLALLLLYQLEAHDVSMRNNASGTSPDAEQPPAAEPEDAREGEDQQDEQQQGGAGNIGQDMSGLAGKAASGPGGQNAMTGQGERGQRAQALSRSDAEELLARIRLDTKTAIDDANRQRLARMRAGASGPFW